MHRPLPHSRFSMPHLDGSDRELPTGTRNLVLAAEFIPQGRVPPKRGGEHRGFRSTDLGLSNGSGADGFWLVGNYCARDDQITFLAFIARRTRVAVQQAISRQRPPQ